jgi:hypothetical protein
VNAADLHPTAATLISAVLNVFAFATGRPFHDSFPWTAKLPRSLKDIQTQANKHALKEGCNTGITWEAGSQQNRQLRA